MFRKLGSGAEIVEQLLHGRSGISVRGVAGCGSDDQGAMETEDAVHRVIERIHVKVGAGSRRLEVNRSGLPGIDRGGQNSGPGYLKCVGFQQVIGDVDSDVVAAGGEDDRPGETRTG